MKRNGRPGAKVALRAGMVSRVAGLVVVMMSSVVVALCASGAAASMRTEERQVEDLDPKRSRWSRTGVRHFWAWLRRGRSKSHRDETAARELSEFADHYVDYLLGAREKMPPLPSDLRTAERALKAVQALKGAYGCESSASTPMGATRRVAFRRRSLATVVDGTHSQGGTLPERVTQWVLARPQRLLERMATRFAKRTAATFLACREVNGTGPAGSDHPSALRALARPYIVIGLAAGTCLAGAGLVVTGHLLEAAPILTLSVGLELIDGEAAKWAADARRAVFIDYLTDRLGDIALLGAVAFHYWHRDPIVGQMALGALVATQFGSYIRSQAIALRFEAPRSMFSRGERLVALVTGLWLAAAFGGEWPMRVGVGIAALSTFWVIIERMVHVVAQGGVVTVDEVTDNRGWTEDFSPTIQVRPSSSLAIAVPPREIGTAPRRLRSTTVRRKTRKRGNGDGFSHPGTA